MLHGHPPRADAVRDDGRILRILRRRVRVDHGDRQLPSQGRPRVGPAADHDETVDPAAQQRADMVLLADRVPPGIAQEHRDLARPEGVLGAHQYRDAEPALQVAGQQTHGARASGQQAPGHLVGPEGEALGRLDHACSGLRPHLAAAVEGLGRRGDRHARQPGDIAEGGGLGTRGAGGLCHGSSPVSRRLPTPSRASQTVRGNFRSCPRPGFRVHLRNRFTQGD